MAFVWMSASLNAASVACENSGTGHESFKKILDAGD
jgi:hypothetical protein